MVMRYHYSLGVGHTYSHDQAPVAVVDPPRQTHHNEEDEISNTGGQESASVPADGEEEDWGEQGWSREHDDGSDSQTDASDDELLLAMDEMYG